MWDYKKKKKKHRQSKKKGNDYNTHLSEETRKRTT